MHLYREQKWGVETREIGENFLIPAPELLVKQIADLSGKNRCGIAQSK